MLPPGLEDPPDVMSPEELFPLEDPPELVFPPEQPDVTFAAFAMACVIISCTWLMVMYGDSGSVGAAEETILFLTLNPST